MDLNEVVMCPEGTNEVVEPRKDSEMNNLEESSANNSNRIEIKEAGNTGNIPPQAVDLKNHNGNAETDVQNTYHTQNSERIGIKDTNIAEHISPQTQATDLENQNNNAEADIQNIHHTQDCLMEDSKNEKTTSECDTNSKSEPENKRNELLNEAIIKIARPLCADYRSDSDSESVDSESDSSQSSSDTMTETSSESEDDSDDSCSSITNINSKQEDKKGKKRDLTIYDLPPIEDLQISVPEDDCVEVGTITSIVDTLVVVESYKNSAALDIDTVLFLDNGKRTLGKVFDILGPIAEPVYAIRFNSQEQIKNLNIEKGLKVYYAPKTPHTTFVFMSEVLKNRGSDASWKDNAEAPPELQDFSDDEEERLHKQRQLKESDGENSSPRDQNRSRKRPFTQFKQKSIQPNSFRNPNFQPTRRPTFQRCPPANHYTPQYSYPRPNPFPFTAYRGPSAPTGPTAPPPVYYPPRIIGPPFPAFGGIPHVNQNFQQPFYQQRTHPGPQNFGAWGNLIFTPPPPPPPAQKEQGDPAGEKEV